MDLHRPSSCAPVCDAEQTLARPVCSRAGFEARIAARRDEEQALEALEAQITELWGHINAATAQCLALLAEFDRRGGWAHCQLQPLAELAMRHQPGGGERESAYCAGFGITAQDRSGLWRRPAVVFEGACAYPSRYISNRRHAIAYCLERHRCTCRAHGTGIPSGAASSGAGRGRGDARASLSELPKGERRQCAG